MRFVEADLNPVRNGHPKPSRATSNPHCRAGKTYPVVITGSMACCQKGETRGHNTLSSAVPGKQAGSQREKEGRHDQQHGDFREYVRQSGPVVHHLADAPEKMG